MPQNCRSGHRHPLPLFCPTLYWAIRTEMNQAGAAVTGEPPVRLRRADMPVARLAHQPRLQTCGKRGQRNGTAVARYLSSVPGTLYADSAKTAVAQPMFVT